MIIDGTNVLTMGVIVGDRSPSRSAAATRQVIDTVPGAWRRKRLGRDAPDALGISLVGHVVGDSLSDLRSNIDQFKFLMRPDYEMAIRWSDMTGDSPVREWLGFRQSLIVNDITPGWITGGVSFSLQLICPDPFAREASTQTPSTSGTLPLIITPTVGTAPMPVIISITRGSSNIVNPVIHYRDSANNDIITISYAGTLTSGQTLVINTETFVAEVNSVNVGGSISGSYFDINPGDGDYLGSPAGPDVRLTADSGQSSDFELSYKRRYW